ncbi:hypothetical protein [Tumebacillus permanentifrigoris]|uniref:IraD/Gp25-like domain-containing protein n=1 Tax=Tumebacillus permanentifrigoris TaxID=378543 RepID=A0A316DEB9_9BACL|nr:hypothetical protein [Tumebacillus permanentifrigoris]PWK16056.1 hypothetical protein C7459_102303 [Tumebacillus permanentifrigoris]
MYEVSGNQAVKVNFGATGIEEILQNVYTSITTMRGSVPLDRGFGLDPSLDDPLPLARARLTTQVIDVVQKYEPRVVVSSVTFAEDGFAGVLVPTVNVRLREGVVL